MHSQSCLSCILLKISGNISRKFKMKTLSSFWTGFGILSAFTIDAERRDLRGMIYAFSVNQLSYHVLPSRLRNIEARPINCAPSSSSEVLLAGEKIRVGV